MRTRGLAHPDAGERSGVVIIVRSLAYKVQSFNAVAVVLRSRLRGMLVLTYGEILTAERASPPRRGLQLHVVLLDEPVYVSSARGRTVIEDELRSRGVRIVDSYGSMITPTFEDFEAELMNRPVRVRQSYDNG